jgi:predicted membrane-bound spermidine synthase
MRKLFSYIIPIIVKTYPSKINGILEVTLLNGRKVLDTARTNYSYGSVQRILQKGLREIQLNQEVKSILVLGLGGGSIVQTIRETFQSQAFITLVDIDPQIISIAKNEFNLLRFPGITLLESDAYVFIQNCPGTFDLIVVDLFIIDIIPPVFTQADFLQRLAAKMNPGAKLIFNTLRHTLDRNVFEGIINQLAAQGLRMWVAPNVEHTNDLILGEKIPYSIGKRKETKK